MDEAVIVNWHHAINTADLGRARQTVSDPIVVSGPKGSSAISAEEFTDWMIHSGIRLEPVNWHPVSGDIAVVEQDATWPEAPDPVRVATMFRTAGGRVSAALRFPDVEQALAFATLHVALMETA
jgi:hypothetical protein